MRTTKHGTHFVFVIITRRGVAVDKISEDKTWVGAGVGAETSAYIGTG